jgi:hypothetical protein
MRHLVRRRVLVVMLMQMMFTRVSAAETCTDFKVGESRKHTASTLSGLFLNANQISYRTIRIEENKYRLEINPVFQIPEKDPYANAQRPAKLRVVESARGEMEKCFQWFNESYGGLLQPQIELGVSTNTTPVYVRLNPDPLFRSYSRQYALNVIGNCPTMVHEALHMMGLYDEYRESSWTVPAPEGTTKYKFDCRARSDSLMADVNRYNQVTYRTEAGPSGFTEMVLPLRPAHLRQLIFPECAEKNPLYLGCIKNAYVTSNSLNQCPAAPPECASPNAWLE